MNLLTKDRRAEKWRASAATIVWFLLAFVGVGLKIRLGDGSIGNYLVFENAFWNMIHQNNPYFVDPAKNLGSFLYGPAFGIIIAPFTILPTSAGAFLWGMANAAFLYFAIRQLPVSYKNQQVILWIAAIEMMTCVQNMQINCLVAGLIILSFVFVQKEKDVWASLCIALGFMIKLYGIVGLVFFLFSRHKLKFSFSFIFWLIVLFCLPMLMSSPSFIVHSYSDWYHTLVQKDAVNTDSLMQNISVMGMLRHLFKTEHLNAIIIVTAALFYALPLLRFKQFNNINFRMSYLAMALIGVVIFSSSAESPTYIIAVTGVAIWYVIQPRQYWLIIALLVLTLALTSLSATDFFPQFLKDNLVRPYALKALPCFLVWLVLAGQLLAKDFNRNLSSSSV